MRLPGWKLAQYWHSRSLEDIMRHASPNMGCCQCYFLDGLFAARGCLAVKPRMTISVDRTEEQGVPWVRIHFPLCRACHSNEIRSIPCSYRRHVMGPAHMHFTLYALKGEIIGWLAHVGPVSCVLRALLILRPEYWTSSNTYSRYSEA